jgi:hypothetical protein
MKENETEFTSKATKQVGQISLTSQERITCQQWNGFIESAHTETEVHCFWQTVPDGHNSRREEILACLEMGSCDG